MDGCEDECVLEVGIKRENRELTMNSSMISLICELLEKLSWFLMFGVVFGEGDLWENCMSWFLEILQKRESGMFK